VAPPPSPPTDTAAGVGDTAQAGDMPTAAPDPSPGPAPDAPTPAGWSDAFDGDALDPAWTVLNGGLADITVGGGLLTIRPLRYSVWFHHEAGPGVVRDVTGDFAITTVVRARSTRRPAEPVRTNFQFGGLIVRDPASDAADAKENYVFSVVGYRGDYLSAETKSTVNDLSMVDGPPWPSGDAEIRICRVGRDLHLYIRDIGATTWTPAITYRRDDLPATVQAGAIAYTYTDDVDLTSTFEFVSLRPVDSARDCVVDA